MSNLKIKIILAFLSIYVIWGSTYLAIKFAIDTMPPFMMASFRFFTAGALLYILLRLTGHKKPERKHWISAALIGSLLLAAANSGVVIATKFISSGVVSLFIAMVPVYIAFLEWLENPGQRPSLKKIAGLLLGTAGIVTLIGPKSFLEPHTINWTGIIAVTASSISWSIGTILSRKVAKPDSLMLGIAMQMICGGIVLGLASLLAREHLHINLLQISSKSFFSLVYLIIFGSIIGYSSFIWLLSHVSPSKVATYAYVNPIVAVCLGASLGGESISNQTLMAGSIILLSVWLITSYSKQEGVRSKTSLSDLG